MSWAEVIERIKVYIGSPMDQCYIASEVAYYILGGKEAGLTPMVAKMKYGTHWWLRTTKGDIIDLTAEQFDTAFPYEEGHGCGFLTKEPSRKAQRIIGLLEYG